MKRIFVTSSHYVAAFGGVDQADALCTASAMAARLGGQWVAWVAIGGGLDPNVAFTALDRLTGHGPWYLVDGKTKIFDGVGNLSTKPLAPINQDEHGASVGILEGAWTGTLLGGIASGNNCQDWTQTMDVTNTLYATVGTPAYTGPGARDSDWTEGSNRAQTADLYFGDCGKRYRLICLEQ